MRFLACLTALCLGFGFLSASAMALEAPSETVKKLYAPYLACDANKADSDCARRIEPSEEAIEHLASRRLKRLIDKNMACEERDAVCAYDSNEIVCGQDSEITYVNVRVLQKKPDEQRIEASFDYFKEPVPKKATYSFLKENGFWKIDDIECGQEKLSTVLMDYKE